MGQELVFPGGDDAPEAFELGDAGVRAGNIEAVQPVPGLGQVPGAVEEVLGRARWSRYGLQSRYGRVRFPGGLRCGVQITWR